MSDWAPGDLGWCREGGFAGSWYLNTGDAYRGPEQGEFVQVFRVAEWQGELGLYLAGYSNPDDHPSHAYGAQYFRRIPPHQADAEDAETVRLLNSEPIPQLTETGHTTIPPRSCGVSDSCRSCPSGAPAAPVSNLLHGPSDSVEALPDNA